MERTTDAGQVARLLAWIFLTGGFLLLGLIATAPDAEAQNFGSRPLQRGDQGNDVIELQIRTAGWYDNCVAGASCYDHFHLDGIFGPKTERAVMNFQKAYDVTVTGRVGDATFRKLRSLRESDESTAHFDWAEFYEKSASCETGNKGTFNGGHVSAWRVMMNVRQLMYRLEAIRHKMNDQHPVYVYSGYRSVEYQNCLRSRYSTAARHSQHSYGTAYDGAMSGVHLGRLRSLAKTSEIHAIFCYGGSSHNHLDIRLDNQHFDGGGRFVWPRRNSDGKDLDLNGNVCKGGHRSPPSTGYKSPAVGVGPVDVWEHVEDPTAVTDAEGQAYQEASEETWMPDDQEIVEDVEPSMTADAHDEIHHDLG